MSCKGKAIVTAAAVALGLGVLAPAGSAQAPQVLEPGLGVREVVDGLVLPVSLAFIGPDDLLVLEKSTGRVQQVVDGRVERTVLDLAVNFASERGLLGIALHPEFRQNGLVYLHWTESATGADTGVLESTPLLGNRVDRFRWDGDTLQHERNIIKLRAAQPVNSPFETRAFGNNNGGVLRFGPDGKLYVFVGDVGRRGQMQNLPFGPTAPGQPDDQFGGPEPDDAHLAGVVLRLDEDGSAPADNPFYGAGAVIGGRVGANVQKVFSYGHRNSFGMAFDPRGAGLWLQENGDDSFTELNLVEPGMNGGWVQVAGPIGRVGQFRAIETDTGQDPVTGSTYFGLQQARWSPERLATTPEDARNRLLMLPGAHYSDPELSWKFEVAPAGLGFLKGRGLGPQHADTMWIGASRNMREDHGYLLRVRLNGKREKVGVDDARLEDRVADNPHKFSLVESESLLVGRGFGAVTDIHTGPDGNLYVVSLTRGAVYEVFRDR